MELGVYQEHNVFTPLQDNSFFFHSHDFVQYSDELTNFCWSLENKEGQVEGRICFSKRGSMAVSLLKSSFGSFELGEGITEDQLSYFVDQMLHKLKVKGFEKVQIISFPEIYNINQFKTIDGVLSKFDFRTTEIYPNQYLPVNPQRNFFSLVKSEERRYLNRGKKLGFDFRRLDITSLPSAYDLIRNCRDDKGYKVSMTYKELEQTILKFPDNYFIFGLFYQGQMIASSVCIKINRNILYDFYHGDDLNFRKHSPVVPLLEGIHMYAQYENYQILDLGTSIEDGVFAFKKNLGAMVSEKVVFERCI
ncbi:hypothetical protein JMN32_12950 [Fulvivirga sp. 29W222]|uniref:BioF2-like acetyltransferase domain-containing protein n=1 Tax=Fulvivirga marina TaxID=2494733 RepID=A0A937FYB3_9BACT|nr:hypothetical protein [Fulvivirga marina]MBL6447223.1 hypothetical protein [Fulvivirga marina]